MEFQPTSESQIREIMRRCPEHTIQAAINYRAHPNLTDARSVVLGILERFVDSPLRPIVQEGCSETRLIEDLAIDSLLFIEIVVVIEDIFEIEIPNEDFPAMSRLGDLHAYLEKRHFARAEAGLAS